MDLGLTDNSANAFHSLEKLLSWTKFKWPFLARSLTLRDFTIHFFFTPRRECMRCVWRWGSVGVWAVCASEHVYFMGFGKGLSWAMSKNPFQVKESLLTMPMHWHCCFIQHSLRFPVNLPTQISWCVNIISCLLSFPFCSSLHFEENFLISVF